MGDPSPRQPGILPCFAVTASRSLDKKQRERTQPAAEEAQFEPIEIRGTRGRLYHGISAVVSGFAMICTLWMAGAGAIEFLTVFLRFRDEEEIEILTEQIAVSNKQPAEIALMNVAVAIDDEVSLRAGRVQVRPVRLPSGSSCSLLGLPLSDIVMFSANLCATGARAPPHGPGGFSCSSQRVLRSNRCLLASSYT